MKFEPAESDKKISPAFIIAYAAFLLIPCFAFYKGWQNHSIIAIVAASVAIIGFSLLLVISIRHNRKIAQKDRNH